MILADKCKLKEVSQPTHLTAHKFLMHLLVALEMKYLNNHDILIYYLYYVKFLNNYQNIFKIFTNLRHGNNCSHLRGNRVVSKNNINLIQIFI
jgi:hypothetical protein